DVLWDFGVRRLDAAWAFAAAALGGAAGIAPGGGEPGRRCWWLQKGSNRSVARQPWHAVEIGVVACELWQTSGLHERDIRAQGGRSLVSIHPQIRAPLGPVDQPVFSPGDG